MNYYSKLIMKENTSLIKALKYMDEGGYGVIFITDEQEILLGVLTDGDVRKALLRGVNLETPVYDVMNRNYISILIDEPRELGEMLLRKLKRKHLPVLDSNHKLMDIILLDEKEFKIIDNPVILMAGGLGTRLYPLTDECPKPLLKVGKKPILERIIEKFKSYGFINFYFSVNYKADMIKKYFGNGEKWGINISYIQETFKMGTAGALSLIKNQVDKPLFVMNGDIMTDINYKSLLDFHHENNAFATMCVREYTMEIPFGTVNINMNRIVNIQEKPKESFFINAGIYVLDAQALQYIPDDKKYDMPELFALLKEKDYDLYAFPIREYWMDIGHMEDYIKANQKME
ncbi:MAG: nucleotidyltransferase family protein [Candidatus Methanofastidiosum sp.]|nr:nucleotidyltransferase family protein [Methanofastidiosum sp.]